MKRASVKDVAKLAQVSTATVSRAFNNPELLNQSTLDAVMKACEELNYTQNSVGRNLRTNRTDSYGVIFYPSCREIFASPFYQRIFEGIESLMVEKRMNIMLSGYDTSAKLDRKPKFLTDSSVDGVILLGGSESDLTGLLKGVSTPVLMLDATAPGVDSVLPDNEQPFKDLVKQFKRQGHRRIAMVTHAESDHNRDKRLSAFKQGAKNAGYTNRTSFVHLVPERRSNKKEDYAGLFELIEKRKMTAVCTNHDTLALEIQKFARARKVKIPEDFVLVGFDDLPEAREAGWLSTHWINKVEMGRIGAEMIIERAKDPSIKPRTRIVAPEFVERKSFVMD